MRAEENVFRPFLLLVPERDQGERRRDGGSPFPTHAAGGDRMSSITCSATPFL